MFLREAQEIGSWLDALSDSDVTPALDLGSADLKFRTQTKPWIDEFVFGPLRARGAKITHSEIAPSEGVDLVANILTEEGYAALSALRPRFIMLFNVLEHVYEPQKMVERCLSMLPSGGRLFITVPRGYPHHTNIDTMLRPTPEEVAAWAPETKLERSTILDTEYHWHELAQSLRKLRLAKVPWLFKPYQVSMLLLAKP